MSYLWSDQSAGRYLQAEKTGTYTVQVSNQSGCHGTAAATVSFKNCNETPSTTISLFPNPAREKVNLEVSGYLPKEASMTVSDALGNIVISPTTLPQLQTLLDLSSFTKGVYFVIISWNDGNRVLQLLKD